MPAYEISNHAAPDHESRHNLVYWRYGEYAGIGPGAHGRLDLVGGRTATRTLRSPERWLAAVETVGHGEEPRETVPADAQLLELLMMGLRLREGVPLERIEAITGRPWRDCIDRKGIERLSAAGWLEVQDGRLIATAAGRQRLDGVLRALV